MGNKITVHNAGDIILTKGKMNHFLPLFTNDTVTLLITGPCNLFAKIDGENRILLKINGVYIILARRQLRVNPVDKKGNPISTTKKGNKQNQFYLIDNKLDFSVDLTTEEVEQIKKGIMPKRQIISKIDMGYSKTHMKYNEKSEKDKEKFYESTSELFATNLGNGFTRLYYWEIVHDKLPAEQLVSLVSLNDNCIPVINLVTIESLFNNTSQTAISIESLNEFQLKKLGLPFEKNMIYFAEHSSEQNNTGNKLQNIKDVFLQFCPKSQLGIEFLENLHNGTCPDTIGKEYEKPLKLFLYLFEIITGLEGFVISPKNDATQKFKLRNDRINLYKAMVTGFVENNKDEEGLKIQNEILDFMKLAGIKLFNPSSDSPDVLPDFAIRGNKKSSPLKQQLVDSGKFPVFSNLDELRAYIEFPSKEEENNIKIKLKNV